MYRLAGLRSAKDLGENKPHGTRPRYAAGCKCVPCRAANSRYESARLVARKNGEWNGIVPAKAAQRHILKLSREGIGTRALSEACDVGRTCIQRVKNGQYTNIRAMTAKRILSVDKRAAADRALISAKRTWWLIDILVDDGGFTKMELARRLGYKTKSLQFNRTRVTAKNAMKVQRFYRTIMDNDGPGRPPRSVAMDRIERARAS